MKAEKYNQKVELNFSEEQVRILRKKYKHLIHSLMSFLIKN
jgi:hypothetical protein